MNRLAGYSCYEKKNADYDKALAYMDELFKTASGRKDPVERLSLYWQEFL